ncbi:endonuclease (plasmid) [Alcanivorax sp. N3-2A]|nr:endonuclease [Alcanivorax sp. N3-2A]ASK36949.1 endonuclease [Alcanivorax sp. N3-2A]|tara:strand:- start:5975 stop:6919 length:945 start_codon:yes stop_codon:yes gene_type:complete
MKTRRALALLALLLAPLAGADCHGLAPPRVVPVAAGDQWSLATLNLWRLRDASKDARFDEPLSEPVYRHRLDALAGYLLDTLRAPPLLALQEIENRAILDALIERIVAAGGPRYQGVLMEGHDPSGMDVALLYRPPVAVGAVRALFSSSRYRGQPLFSRPPLAVSLKQPVEATVVVVHLRSARDLGRKAWVAEKRRRQASALGDWIAARRGALIVAGDFNSAPEPGLFGEPWRLIGASGLYDSWQRLDRDERYSFRHRCQPQALDHILMSKTLLPKLRAVAVSRGNAGRYDRLYGSNGTEVVSDHDALVVYFQK